MTNGTPAPAPVLQEKTKGNVQHFSLRLFIYQSFGGSLEDDFLLALYSSIFAKTHEPTPVATPTIPLTTKES